MYSKTNVRVSFVWIMSCRSTILACFRLLRRDAGETEMKLWAQELLLAVEVAYLWPGLYMASSIRLSGKIAGPDTLKLREGVTWPSWNSLAPCILQGGFHPKGRLATLSPLALSHGFWEDALIQHILWLPRLHMGAATQFWGKVDFVQKRVCSHFQEVQYQGVCADICASVNRFRC